MGITQERDTNQWTPTEIPALPVSSQTAAARSPWAQLAAAFGMASSWAGPKRHEGCACPPPSRLSKRRRRAWAAASPCGAACTPASIAHSPICEERKGSLRSGVVGGGLLALIEGIVFVISRQSPAQQQDFGYAPPPPPLEDVLDVEEKGGFLSSLTNLFSKKEESKPFEMEEEMTMDDFGQETKEDDFGDLFQPPPATSWGDDSWNTEEKEHS